MVWMIENVVAPAHTPWGMPGEVIPAGRLLHAPLHTLLAWSWGYMRGRRRSRSSRPSHPPLFALRTPARRAPHERVVGLLKDLLVLPQPSVEQDAPPRGHRASRGPVDPHPLLARRRASDRPNRPRVR